jgi:UDP-N-acetylmuramoyl-L-alanyl-D-glutamate--2,6-diaminopimelate ligase
MVTTTPSGLRKMKLSKIINSIEEKLGIPTSMIVGDVLIGGISIDSRTTKAGDLFIGLPGTKSDGEKHWSEAVRNGASGLILSKSAYATFDKTDILHFVFENSEMNKVYGCAAATFYGNPTNKMNLVGVTGTNGKTTVTHLIEHILQQTQIKTALIGTLYSRYPGFVQESSLTTPIATDLQKTLADALETGVDHAVMEVSSHSLDQARVYPCEFDVAVWTNLTQDHLDYHGTIAKYWLAKTHLFFPPYLENPSSAVINIDDEGGKSLYKQLIKTSDSEPILYSTEYIFNLDQEYPNLIWPTKVRYHYNKTIAEIETPIGKITIESALIGKFNLANTLAAIGACISLGLSLNEIETGIKTFKGVPGRMTPISVPNQDILIYVDYAHTPDALKSVLTTIKTTVQNRLMCVFGCGGDRDRTKRSQMGKIVAKYADWAIVTSDNPRTEDPSKIIDEIMAGILADGGLRYKVEPDRAKAIENTILKAKPGDTIVIAGKGHEDYQIIGTEKTYFDDSVHALNALKMRMSKV